jgi:hypothetical protein
LPGRDDFIIDNLGEKLLARSNRGTRHPRNEDYAALDSVEVGGKKIVWLIVCDGLSTSKNPQKASEAACKAASRVLRIAALSGQEGSDASKLPKRLWLPFPLSSTPTRKILRRPQPSRSPT